MESTYYLDKCEEEKLQIDKKYKDKIDQKIKYYKEKCAEEKLEVDKKYEKIYNEDIYSQI